MVDLIVLACVVFAFGIVSRRVEGTVLTAPIVFVLAGVDLGPVGLGWRASRVWELRSPATLLPAV